MRPRGCAWGGKRGCFLGEGGEGAKKVFGVLPVATAQISSGLRFSSWRGRKKSLGEYLAGTGERPIFAPASDKDEGRGRGGGSGGSLRQCSEKKEEQKVNKRSGSEGYKRAGAQAPAGNFYNGEFDPGSG